MTGETKVQAFVHKLEEGGWATWIRRAVLVAAISYISYLWLFNESGFRGLSHEKAMEQAQIAREIARGNGFSTKMIRPAALWQFQSNKGAFPLENTPDTYHAPLPPLITSLFIRFAKESWTMTAKDVLYPSDKIIAALQLTFFLLAVLVSYLTAKRLFDKRLALLGMGLLLVCQKFWDFSMSGLPQMLLLFLFSSACYVMVRAVEARYEGKPTLLWSVAAGVLFGLLALSHALTLFVFAGALIFTAIFFRPIGRNAGVMLAVVALFYTPWLVRNYRVCGNPLGIGWYSGLFQVRGTESQVMRTMALEGPLHDVTPAIFGEKLRTQAVMQLTELYHYLGYVVVAPFFVIALLHLFKRRETAVFRWCILSMWLLGFLGMMIFGLEGRGANVSGSPVEANDLHILFVPMMTFYGLAFVLVLWTRLELTVRVVRIGFIVLIFVLSGIPFLAQFMELMSAPKNRVHFPPYVPPHITFVNLWTNEREVVATDMPWATAWYADRKSLWLPMSLRDFIELNDYNRLGGNLVALVLTPVTSNQRLFSDIAQGEYKEWVPFIVRNTNVRELKDFPLRAATAFSMQNSYIIYADRDRWSARED